MNNILKAGDGLNTIIKVKDVVKNYGKKDSIVRALDYASMNIERGKITALLGPNGSGKSTLIKSICGLIEVDSGEILVNNQNISSNRKVMDSMGCILEGERNIYYYLTVYDNLYYFGKLNKIKRNKLKLKIEEVLIQLNLVHKKKNYVSELSRGMQQKVALAILLIKDPEILLLDEPTLGLDVQSSIQLNNYLVYLCDVKGKTIILTTHQLDLAEQISHNIIFFQNGKVLLNKTKKEIKEQYQPDLKVKIYFKDLLTAQQKDILLKYGSIEIHDGNFHVIAEASNISEIYSICKDIGIEITEISTDKKTLQDVFLQVTGG